MRILVINVVCGIGSTGRICTDLASLLDKQGHEVKIAYGRGMVPKEYLKYAVRIGTDFDVKLHALKTRLFDSAGRGSKRITRKFVIWVKEYDPDIIYLHNLHGYYINVEILFDFLRTYEKKIIWTLHDCWAFTGHCTHFSFVGCDQWKSECRKCIQKREYPASYFMDKCNHNYKLKQKLFCGIDQMEIVVPSRWLANLVKKSYLASYPVKILPNRIDRTLFRPVQGNIKEKYNIKDKKMILGVSSVWNERKGLEDFIELSKMLNEQFVVVLVGLTRKQIKKLPHNMIGIPKTHDIEELVNIYSSANVFVNPSKEETFGLTTLEALSCGTVSIVYSGTACEEVANEYGGIVVAPDIQNLKKEIYACCGID